MIKPNEVSGDEVTQRMSQFRFYSQRQFEDQTGYSVPFLFKTSLLAYALSYGNLNYSKNHSPVHYNDTATSPWFRFKESGFWLEPNAMVLAMTHDLPEDIGKNLSKKKSTTYSLLASYVIMDVIDSVLARETGMDIDALLGLVTNKGEIIFGPTAKHFESRIVPGNASEVDPMDLVRRIKSDHGAIPRKWGAFYNHNINMAYTSVLKRLERTLNALYSPGHEADLSHDERKYVGDTIREFVRTIESRRTGNEKPKARELKGFVDFEFEKLIQRVSFGNFAEIDPQLVLPSSSETVVRIKTTLYGEYVGEIMDVSNAQQYAGTDLDPAVVKCADARDTASRLGPNLDNIVNQFRKHTIILEKGVEAVNYRKVAGVGYGNLDRALIFLLETLNEALVSRRDTKESEKIENTQYKIEYETLDYMAWLMSGLRTRLGMPPGLDDMFKTIPNDDKIARIVRDAMKRANGRPD
ncbi:MAG: hypothetical protein AABX00_03110 [Nanoarchaeota archaeon]